MSQVMRYGFPNQDWLLCENPVCDEKAAFVATEVAHDLLAPSAKARNLPKEVYGCTEHISQLTSKRPSMRLVKLKTPGERNVQPVDTTKKV